MRDYGTLTLIVFFTIALYRSIPTTVTLCFPAATPTLAFSWSLNDCARLEPSIHNSTRFTPLGELPLALTVSALTAVAAEQILTASVPEPGGAQLVAAF